MVKLSMMKLPTYGRGRGGRKITKTPKEDLKAKNTFDEIANEKILDEVHELFDGTYGVVRPGPWKRAFRPSGFPYCPILDALAGTEDMDYAKAFYLDVGTTVHELMQEYISRSPRGRRVVYANWKCKDCEGMHYFTPLPFVCHHCGVSSERLHYEELEFENFRGIQGGHVDLFIKTSEGWIVADWKTASTTGLDYRSEADGKHHHQLQAYCLALETLFADKLEGLPIIGYMLIFVPRDVSGNRSTKGSNWTPYLYAWNKKLATETRRRLFMQRASYDAASIGHETDNWYPAALLRPCNSLADFGKPMGMQDAFYQGKPCPNLDICSRGSKDVATAVSNVRADMVHAAQIKVTVENKLQTTLLESAEQGFIDPALLAEIQLAADAEDYEHEYHESLLAMKESLQRLIDTRKALGGRKRKPANPLKK